MEVSAVGGQKTPTVHSRFLPKSNTSLSLYMASARRDLAIRRTSQTKISNL